MSEPYTGNSDDPNVGGLAGVNTSAAGVGVWGEAQTGRGVVGVSGSGVGVWGATRTGRAVVGAVDGGTSTDDAAVWGETKRGRGVVGVVNEAGTGVWGTVKVGRGVVGIVDGGTSTDDAAVWGETKSGRGVVGVVNGSGGSGVFGTTTNGRAVVGVDSDTGEGVHGETKGGRAVVGIADASGHGSGIYGEMRGADGYAGFFEGRVRVTGPFETAGNMHCAGSLNVLDVFLHGADCAEDFDVTPGHEAEPGTLMVVADDGSLRPCQGAYDRRVAGVVSGAGTYRPALRLDRRPDRADRVPIALLGKVWCKADATQHSINIGDLLTTSDTPGHARKATDPQRGFGAVIGKALGNLPTGVGMVPILVCLQ